MEVWICSSAPGVPSTLYRLDIYSSSCCPSPKQLLTTCLTLPDHHASSSLSESLAPPSPNLASSVLASPTLASMAFDFRLSSSLATSFGRKGKDDGYADAHPASPTLAELTMETLLCALVDMPENTKLFEELGGVGEVVRLLRGKVEGGRAAKWVWYP